MSSDTDTQADTLQLELDEGRTLAVEIRRRTSERSPHSGRELIELHGWASTPDAEAHRWISSTLRSAVDRSVVAHDARGEFAGRWCLSWNSYGESAGVHSYALLLREYEELSLETLVVEGIELHPYEYREDVVGDGLLVQAKVVGSELEVERIGALMRSRQVVTVMRRGIDDAPREMRLALAEWSRGDDRIKYRIILIDRWLEGASRSELSWIEEERNRAALGFYANLLERLADAMVEKGVVTREELAALREGARIAPGLVRHEMWRVADIDEA